MRPTNEASRPALHRETAQAINQKPSRLKSTAKDESSSTALRRARGTFPHSDLRHLLRTGTLNDWLEIATASRLSVTGGAR